MDQVRSIECYKLFLEFIRTCRSQSEQSLYDIKIHFLKNVLYGVDIDPIAIEISKLRALLTNC